MAVTLFAGALLLYLFTRLAGIDRYPIYFFTDEAAHTVSASAFIENGLRNSDNELLPTYFSLGASYNLNSVSVYLQVLPYLIFGKSEAVTRGTSALVTVLAAIAVGLTMRDIFKARYWWVATLLLSTAPAWFLHSRTSFEYIEVASFYAVFLYCYLRYHCDAPRFLYPAIFFGALTFYTHGLGAALMALTSVLLFISDLPYHWRQRAIILRGLILVGVLALPFLRYSIAHPSSFISALRQRDSYWTDIHLTLLDKIQKFAGEYAYGLSPAYWFKPDPGHDLERHVMLGYGNLWWPTLPLAALGLGLALRRAATSAYRTILFAMLAAPAGSALVAIGIARVLWFMIPAVLLMALGLNAVLEWFEARRAPFAALSIAAFVVLGGFNLYLLTDALRNGPLWPKDYSLYGVQYGARQLFGEKIPALLAADPNLQVSVSPDWANGTDLLVLFFMTPQQQRRIQLQGADYFLAQKRDLPPDLTVVLIPDQYARFTADPKIDHVQLQQVLPYPNGQPGFYFLRFTYSAQADALFEAEHEAFIKPKTETIAFAGQTISVTHPQLGAGQLKDIFDGDPFTLINAPSFNPLVLDFSFPTAHPMNGLTLTTGAMVDFTVTATVFANTTGLPQVYSQEFVGLPPDPTVQFKFGDGPNAAVRLRLEIENNGDHTPYVNIHVRELQFR